MPIRRPGALTAIREPLAAPADAAPADAAAPASDQPATALPGDQPPAAPGLSARARWLIALLAFVPILLLRAGTLAEADTFWQIRTGLLTVASRAIPAVDTFSWTMRGKPWTLNSWAFNVLIALVYRIADLPGVALACAALALAAVGLVLLLARQLGASPVVAGVTMFLASPLLVVWMSARPQLADYLAVLGLVMLLRRIAAGQHPGWSVMGVGALSAVWVNLHAASLLGVGIAVASAALLLARRGTRRGGAWCLAAAGAALAGTFANPYGLQVLSQTAQVQKDSAGLMAEWQHASFAIPGQDLTLAIGALALVLAVRRGEAVLAATLAIVATGAVFAIRLMPFVVLVAVPLLAAWASDPPPAIARYARSRRVMFYRCGVAGLVAVAAVTAPNLTHLGRPDPASYPAAVVRAIPPGCHLFTTDILGGFVILKRPSVPVSVDTRNTLYGRQRILAYRRVVQGRGNLAAELAGAGCVLVPPGSGLALRLRRDPAWRATTAAPAGVLFVRR